MSSTQLTVSDAEVEAWKQRVGCAASCTTAEVFSVLSAGEDLIHRLHRDRQTAEARSAAGVGWRPIATAPKDGTAIDVWRAGAGRMANVAWRRGAEVDPRRCGPGGIWERLALDGWRGLGDQDGCSCLVADQFTHWMPIPTPPAEGAPNAH